VNWLKLAIFILVILAIGLAAMPLLVLLDLMSGGTGFGLCSDGLTSCRRQYTSGPELAAILTVGLMAVVAAIRMVSRLSRRLNRDVNEPR
jgi:hypothetical protein